MAAAFIRCSTQSGLACTMIYSLSTLMFTHKYYDQAAVVRHLLLQEMNCTNTIVIDFSPNF